MSTVLAGSTVVAYHVMCHSSLPLWGSLVFRDIKLINGLWPLKSLAGFSDSPAMYGFRLVPVELVGSVFLGSGLGFISLPRHAVPLTAVFVLFTHELDM